MMHFFTDFSMFRTKKSHSGNYNVLLFWFYDDWGKYGRTYENVAEHLSRLPDVNHVVVVFPPEEIDRGAINPRCRIRKFSDKLTVVTQLTRIIPEKRILQILRGKIHKMLSNRAFTRLLKEEGFTRDNTILWFFPPHPYLEELLETVPHTMVVTQLVDNFAELDETHWLHGYAKAQYPKVSSFSDIIITSSKMNYELFKRTSNACYLFENAVNSRFICKPSTFPYRENNAKPRIGYVGWITKRTDLNLLQYVVREKPQWTLILAGPQSNNDLEMRDLLKLKNVRYSEYIPHEDVPAFIRSLDVCLIPHRDTPYSRSMSPLKLFQCLASGRPIVSTNVAGLERFASYLKVATDYEGFVRGIADTLENDTLGDSRKRISVALHETWDRRTQEIFSLVKSRCVLISTSLR